MQQPPRATTAGPLMTRLIHESMLRLSAPEWRRVACRTCSQGLVTADLQLRSQLQPCSMQADLLCQDEHILARGRPALSWLQEEV